MRSVMRNCYGSAAGRAGGGSETAPRELPPAKIDRRRYGFERAKLRVRLRVGYSRKVSIPARP